MPNKSSNWQCAHHNRIAAAPLRTALQGAPPACPAPLARTATAAQTRSAWNGETVGCAVGWGEGCSDAASSAASPPPAWQCHQAARCADRSLRPQQGTLPDLLALSRVPLQPGGQQQLASRFHHLPALHQGHPIYLQGGQQQLPLRGAAARSQLTRHAQGQAAWPAVCMRWGA